MSFERLGSVWPLAAGSMRRSWHRQLLMASVLGLAVASYLLYATFLAGAGQEAQLLVRPLQLPCDLVFIGRRPLSAAEVADVSRRGVVTACEVARVAWYPSEAGRLRVVFLPETSRLWASLVKGDASGRSAPAGAGQVLVPSWLAERRGLGEGGVLRLRQAGSPGAELELTVAGVHAATDDLLKGCAVTSMASLGAPDSWPNALLVWTTTARAADLLASSLEATYGQPLRPILRTMDDAAVLTASRPLKMSSLVLAQTYLPGAGVMTMVFAFCGVGLFTTVTLGFLDRRRDIAILKTIGLDSNGVVAMLLIEQVMIALCGAALGTAIAAVTIPRLAGFFPGNPVLSGLTVLKGAFVGAAVLAAAAFLPAATARVATVNQLLYNLPVPLKTQRVSGQTGA